MNKCILSLCFLFFTFLSSAQKVDSLQIRSEYDEKNLLPKENIALITNKNVYQGGENIGYSIFVNDRNTGLPSLLTSNMYVQLKKEDGSTVISRLLEVQNGHASDVIKIDSLVSPGNYELISYINWMRNDSNPLYGISHISVLDTTKNAIVTSEYSTQKSNSKFTISPASGKYVYGIKNRVALHLTDSNGYGLSEYGELLENGRPILKFKTNELGHGSFYFIPNKESKYIAQIKVAGKTYKKTINNLSEIGYVVDIINKSDKVILDINTNEETLTLQKKKKN